MNILTFLIVGLVAGWLAGVIVKGHGFGVLVDIVIGIIGALVGGFIFPALGLRATGLLEAIVMSMAGAVLFLVVLNLFSRKRGHS